MGGCVERWSGDGDQDGEARGIACGVAAVVDDLAVVLAGVGLRGAGDCQRVGLGAGEVWVVKEIRAVFSPLVGEGLAAGGGDGEGSIDGVGGEMMHVVYILHASIGPLCSISNVVVDAVLGGRHGVYILHACPPGRRGLFHTERP